MSNTTDKRLVKGEWQTTKINAEVLKSVATLYTTVNTILATDAKAADEAAKAILINKQYYADLDINTPKDLAKAIAEYTTNVLGVKVSTVETGNKATLVFEGGAFVHKLATIRNLPHEVSEKLLTVYKDGLADLGGYYGFVTEISSVQPDFIVSFSK